MAQVMLALHDVTKVYGKGEGRVTALRRVSLRFEQGEFTAIVGPSGSGKTTLLNIIGCLDSPTEGGLVWKGVQMKSMDKAELAAYRRTHVSFVFQSFNLIPVLTVTENVELPLLIEGNHNRGGRGLHGSFCWGRGGSRSSRAFRCRYSGSTTRAFCRRASCLNSKTSWAEDLTSTRRGAGSSPLLLQASSGNWAHPGPAVCPPIETFYNIQHYSSNHRGGHRV